MPFKKGQSGNRDGRPRGAKNKLTLHREELLDALPDVLEKLIISAKRGSYRQMKMVLERTMPPLKALDSPINLRLRGSIADKAQTVVNGVSGGKITPEEGIKLMTLLTDQAKIIETHELAQRIKNIEELLENESN